jgi:hypothetical protein
MSKTILETVTGRFVDVMNPTPDMISFEDIAWSLSRQARFNGHTISTTPYSVAQHSVAVAKRVERFGHHDLMLAALLHDAAEAYISDIPSPIKNIPGVRESVKAVEGKILRVVFEALGVAYPDDVYWGVIHDADMWCRAVEAHAFMSSRGKHWDGLPTPSLIELQNFDQPKDAVTAYQEFKNYYQHCLTGINNEN